MKKPIMLILVIICISFLYAENSDINLKFGVEISPTIRWQKTENHAINLTSKKEKLSFGPSADIFMNCNLSKRINIKNILGFETLTGKDEQTYSYYDEDMIIRNFKVQSSFKVNNLIFAIIPEYQFDSGINLGLGTKFRFPISDLDCKDKSSSEENSYSIKQSMLVSPNISAIVSMSYTYNRYLFSIDYDHGFSKLLDKDCSYTQFFNWKPRSTSLSIGYILY